MLGALIALAPLPGCGIFALQRDHEKESTKVEALVKENGEQKQEIQALRADLEATRERLDNATRAYADKGEDIVNQKQKVNLLTGRVEDHTQALDDLRKEVASFRTEVNGRLDELKRSQEAQATKPAPPPPTIPTDKAQHLAAIDAAYAKNDWAMTRTFGREYLNRYPTDDKSDDVLYMMGDGELKEGRPSSALGEFNRLIKLNSKSNVLDKTLFAMGEAYLMMHDCENAKLAYQACVNRFAKEPLGVQAKQKIATIEKKPAGMCAPQ